MKLKDRLIATVLFIILISGHSLTNPKLFPETNKSLKQVAFLFLLAFIPFAFFAVSQQGFADGDSFYYLNIVCNKALPVNDSSLLFPTLANLLPCNFVFLKALNFILFFLFLIFLVRIGKLFDEEKGWLLAVIAFSFTFIISEFWKFENDIWGITLGTLGLYFVLKTFTSKEFKENKYVGIDFYKACLCFAVAGLIWGGTIYWLGVAGIFVSFYFIPFGIAFLLFGTGSFFWFLTANPNIWENTAGIGLIYLGLTVFFLYGCLKTSKKITLAFIILLVPALLASKMYVLAVPFACLIAFEGLKLLSGLKVWEGIKAGLLIFALLMTVFWCINLSHQFPTNDDLTLIKKAVSLDKNLQNSFGAGYIIEFYGGTASQKGGDYNNLAFKGFVVLQNDKNYSKNCKVLSKSATLLLLSC